MTAQFRAQPQSDGTLSGHFYTSWSNAAAKFMRTHRFKRVHFEGSWGDMAFLQEFGDFIETIFIANENMRADGIASLVNLRSLFMHHQTRKPIDLTILQQLESCSISWHPVYASELFALPKLESASISNFTTANFGPVSPHRTLKRLCLNSPRLENFEGISRFSNLESLEVTKGTRLVSFDGLDELPRLRDLRVESAKNLASCQGLALVTGLEQLVLLNVSGALTTSFSAPLAQLKQLIISAIPVVPDWEALITMEALLKISLMVAESDVLTEEFVHEYAARAGKKVLRFDSTLR